ncbi:hypothetical protein P7C71_g3847, partial [Lecanoromycetidae sp. Uapishka_2]
MIDPIPPRSINVLSQPIADRFSLQTLPLHVHEILLGLGVYHVIFTYVSPVLSRCFFPATYPRASLHTKINWDIHVVSMFNSVFICSLALWVLLGDEERKKMDAEERIWGYTGAMGMTQAFAAGYFVWDTWASALYLEVTGPGALAHAVSALTISSLGFRPFANYYGIAFILYEMSTPFLNMHWFLDKCNMTGTSFQLYNGIVLLVTFLASRLVWGTYQSLRMYQDIWLVSQTAGSSAKNWYSSGPVSPSREPLGSMRFAGKRALPPWLPLVYLGSNTLLTLLNFYWFWRMIAAVKKRFPPPPPKGDPKVAKD